MYLYIIIALALAAVAPELSAGDAPPRLGALALQTVSMAALVALVGVLIAAYIRLGRGRLTQDEQGFLRRVSALGRLYRLTVVLIYAYSLFVLGWGAMAARAVELEGRQLAGVGVALAPYLAYLLVSWIAVFGADRTLRIALFERAGAVADVRWTLGGYLEFQLRQYLLVLLVPMLVLVGLDDLLAPWMDVPVLRPWAMALSFGCLAAMIVLAGGWVRLCWRTEPLPAGDLRSRLRALADRAGIHLSEILLWRTNQSIANGMMIGVAAPCRYILMTDALLLSMSGVPEEVEAVFAHEVGHAKHRHTLLFLPLAMGASSAGLIAGFLAETLAPPAWFYWMEEAGLPASGEFLLPLVSAAVSLSLLWFGFGYVSRRCELEADLYAVRATTCPAGCSPPEAVGVAGRICEHRVAAFTGALQRIARLNGIPENRRGWRHFSIARRCALLTRLWVDPWALARVENHIRLTKAVAGTAAVFLVGVATLLVVLQSYNPEHPAGPRYIDPSRPTWLVRLVDRDQVDAVAFRSPQLDRQAHPPANMDDGGLAGLGQDVAPADHQVAVEDARGHAVSVDAQGEGPGAGLRQAGQVQVLGHAVGRGRG
jgi:STE24 endopeptidase